MNSNKTFAGIVILKDWVVGLDGQNYTQFVGNVSLLRDVEAVGFGVSRGESNWIARVEGWTTTFNFLGCQVRGVVQLDKLPEKLHVAAYIVP
jgi:hypothetical protein